MQNLEFNVSNFFSRLIFHPSEGKNEEDRRDAWIATIALGIFTGGLVHLACGIYQLGCYFQEKWIEKKNSENLNPEDKNAQNVAMKILEGQNKPIGPVEEKPIVPVEEKPIGPVKEKPIGLVEKPVGVIDEQETKLGQPQPEPIFSEKCSKDWIEKARPEIEKLMQKLPRAYFCIELWGAARKMEVPSIEQLADKFKKDSSFEKLPVILIVFRNSDLEKVRKLDFEEYISQHNEINLCCAVTLPQYNHKIIEGESYEVAISQIKTACQEWYQRHKLSFPEK